MLNNIWVFMVVGGIIVGFLNGSINLMTEGIIDASRDAVSLCITMLSLVSMWCGIMKIAENSGLVQKLSKSLLPLLSYLFPDLKKNHRAMSSISANLIANFLGLGWAATPTGIKAMQDMNKVNKDKTKASRSMCMFMVINMSSVQLVSINILTYRAQYGSLNPAEVIGPSILATIISTLTGIILCKIAEKLY